jgi:hypothetical protein
MQSKSIFLSVTFWGAALSGLLAIVDHLTGVKLNDQVGPLESAVTELVQALLVALPSFSLPVAHLIAVLTIIVGRFRAVQPLHLIPPTTAQFRPFPGALPSFAVAAVMACALSGLTGCGTVVSSSTGGALPSPSGASTPSGSPAVGSIIESALPLIRTGAAVATGAVLDFAVQQSSTRSRLANEMYASANAVYSLTGGTFPTPSQFTSTLTAYGQAGDAQYAQYTSALSALYAAYFPKLQTGDTKTATDLLNAIAGGIEDATASYVTTPTTATLEPITSF